MGGCAWRGVWGLYGLLCAHRVVSDHEFFSRLFVTVMFLFIFFRFAYFYRLFEVLPMHIRHTHWKMELVGGWAWVVGYSCSSLRCSHVSALGDSKLDDGWPENF